MIVARAILLRRRRLRRTQRGLPTPLALGLALGLVLLIIPLGTAAGVYSYFAKDLPSSEAMVDRQLAQSTKIYDRKGRLLYEVFDPQGGRRTIVPLSQIAPAMITATIATEDADFYENPGLNLRGLVRAVLLNLLGREGAPGGSSITQQLVKNALLPEEERSQRTVSRKIREAILALELTRRYSKDQILEWYLNEIYYGNMSDGVEAAAKNYFGKSAKDLNLAEAAMLAGLPQSPGLYSPLDNPKQAKARQEAVLDLMVHHGRLTRAEAEAAKKEPLVYQPRRFPIEAPHFVAYVRQILEQRYGSHALYRGGLKVTTSIDLDLQNLAQELVRKQAEQLVKTSNASNGALVALRPQTGEILVMVGSADYFNDSIDGQVNMALADRQPGSAFKLFTYATAFLKGHGPATMLLDIPTAFPNPPQAPYAPENIDYKYWGPISTREALGNSRNIPAVRELQFAGVSDVIDLAHRLGITTLNRKDTYGLALTLGGGEVKLLDLVFGNAVFANGGIMAGASVPEAERRLGHRELQPVAILKVEDAQGRILEEFKEPKTKEELSPQVAYLVTDILADNEARSRVFGSNSSLRLSRPAAAKTGTSEDWRDNWTVGYTPHLVAGVWIGNSDNTAMRPRTYGSTSTAPIWHDFMEQALRGTPADPFSVPSGLMKVAVCYPSGLLPTPICPETRAEIFVKDQEPKEEDHLYQLVRIDRTTGKRAGPGTPPEHIEEKVFMVLPPEADDWARDNGVPQPPAEFVAPASGVALASPAAGSAVRGQAEVWGSTESEHFLRWSLEYGQGLSPTRWHTLVASQDGLVRNGRLGIFATVGLDGPYTLRLTVVDEVRGLLRSEVLVSVDNAPPTVEVTYPHSGSTLYIKADETVPIYLQATATDNLGIARVEFFADDVLIGRSTIYPYRRPWTASPGPHVLHAVAHDKAGNSTKSPSVSVTVR